MQSTVWKLYEVLEINSMKIMLEEDIASFTRDVRENIYPLKLCKCIMG